MDLPNQGIQESDANQQVTIPYFLYEAMARAYYGQARTADLPVEEPAVVNQEKPSMKDFFFNPSDVPPTWKPGGVAVRGTVNESSDLQSAQEED